ncbi:MAG: transposase [bacterium]|nr:transposase [bacterium]
MTDGVFSAGDDDEAVFHPALDLERDDFEAVQAKMRHRGLRWLHRHGHLDDDALHVLDSLEHGGGWSVDASVTIPGWDRQGLERLVRYCARPPLSQERLGRLNEQTLVYSLRRPTADGRTELLLTPLELLDLLAQLVTSPRLHKPRYCGVLAPTAALREAVTASAGPAGATLQLLEQARASMGLPAAEPAEPDPSSPLLKLRRAAARCWALLLVRIYECLPLRCPKCGELMRNIAFVLDQPQVERILEHIGVIGERAWLPSVPKRLPPVGRRPTAHAAARSAAGAIAAAAGVRVRPDDRHRRLAGDGPDGGAAADGWE